MKIGNASGAYAPSCRALRARQVLIKILRKVHSKIISKILSKILSKIINKILSKIISKTLRKTQHKILKTSESNKKQKKVTSLEPNFFQFCIENNAYEIFDKTDEFN